MAKPASGTALDTGHSLYANLLHAWAFLEGSGSTTADSRNGNTLTIGGTAAWATNGAGEPIIDMPSASGSQLDPASDVTLSNAQTWSLAWSAKQDVSGTAGIFAGNGSSSSSSFLFFNGGSLLRYRPLDPGVDSDFSGVTDFTQDDDWVLVFDQPNARLHLYRNGSEVSGSPDTTSVLGDFAITRLGSGGNSASFALVGDMTYFYVWDGRALSGAEAATLAVDPYVIFEGEAATPLAPPVFRRRRMFR